MILCLLLVEDLVLSWEEVLVVIVDRLQLKVQAVVWSLWRKKKENKKSYRP